MKCHTWASVLCLVVGASIAAGSPAMTGEPVDCTAVAAKVDAQIRKAESASKDDRGNVLWEGRTALREALRLPDSGGLECWKAAARLAIAAKDEELAVFALDAFKTLKAQASEAALIKDLTGIADKETLKTLARDRGVFLADLKKAEGGDAASMTAVGEHYSEGKGIPADDEFGVEWYTKAADKGHPFGTVRLGQRKNAGVGTKQDKEGAFKLFEKAAELGDVTGIANVGGCYLKGEGVAKDEVLALKWTLKAADKGDVASMAAAGVMYMNGTGTEANITKAIEWYTRAARKGDANSMLLLGSLYFGFGSKEVKVNGPLAEEWLTKAINSKDEVAVRSASATLGAQYMTGAVVKKDVSKGFQLLKKSYDLGFEKSAYMLGMCYMRGEGTAKDPTKAASLYKEAAEGGDSMAMFSLWACMRDGVGCEKNPTKAQEWLEKSAGGGYQKAKEELAKQKK